MILLLCFFLLFFNLISAFNTILYKLKNPIIASSSLIIGKKYISSLSKLDIDSNLSRKIIHISCAPSFISTWIFYNKYYPKTIASLVPFISSFYLIYKKDNLKKSISRSGNSNELLKGPLIYTIILTFLTFKYWFYNEIGILAMLQLSIGDGFADIIGRKYGKHKWFFNKKKSIEGTFGFILSSFIISTIILKFYYNYKINISKIFVISFMSGLIELIPFIDDNISIPLFILNIYNFLN